MTKQACGAGLLAALGCRAEPPAPVEPPAPTPPVVIRVATYNAALHREPAGALLEAIESGDPHVDAVAAVVRTLDADVLLLNEIDADPAVVDAFVTRGLPEQGYAHRFVPASNTGVPTGFDLDRDGVTDGPGDAKGYGRYEGQYGMALLSRFPIVRSTCFGDRPWASFSWATLPDDPQTPAPGDWYDVSARAVLPLSSKNHCDVLLETPAGPLHALISHPTPPAFDGPEDRNGLRNADEIEFWIHHIDALEAGAAFVVLGDLNADPHDGDTAAAIAALLEHPRVVDPTPGSDGAAAAARAQGNRNEVHAGDPRLDTADWDDAVVGNLRVDYALPSTTLDVKAAGVMWPLNDDAPSDHHPVWVDLTPL